MRRNRGDNLWAKSELHPEEAVVLGNTQRLPVVYSEHQESKMLGIAVAASASSDPADL